MDTFDMHRKICTLLNICTRNNHIITRTLQQKNVVEKLLVLFDICCSDLGMIIMHIYAIYVIYF